LTKGSQRAQLRFNKGLNEGIIEGKTLKEKYQQLFLENNRLREEIKRLRTERGMDTIHEDSQANNIVSEYLAVPEPELFDRHIETKPSAPSEAIDKLSDASTKIRLFQSLFRGRDDVYAKRWENKAKGTAGYSPVCGNEWKTGICQKPKIKCSTCNHKDFLPFDEVAIDGHLRGRQNLVAGLYPLLSNETCWFLAIDFDDDGWQKDVTTLREVCSLFGVPVAVERSRSGNGAHAWFFFVNPVRASLARKFGSSLLTYAMSQRHEITFKSYDRFFPNQDTLPKGGFGNLIALPLQKTARRNNNSVFIDDHFHPIEDQWAFLASFQTGLGDQLTMLCKFLVAIDLIDSSIFQIQSG
jgi:hypothetical protein